MKLKVNNTFIESLPADSEKDNFRRQVHEACFSYVTPKEPKSPSLIHFSEELINELGLEELIEDKEQFVDIFSGKKLFQDTQPYAMCYGGHQFGHWAGQLGDGRATNLFQLDTKKGNWAFQLKGAGETPYSRSADGLAVLRSSIREYLCSEAMHHLGVPTTRALSLVLSGDNVLRDVMYNGNADYEPGAIVCRVSPSFLRFGSFEIFSSRGDKETLRKLTDYTISEHYPEIKSTGKQKYLDFFKAVMYKTLDLVIHWQRVGFVHGVLNTDNMSVLGLTIDYGPYGWLEGYEYDWTPNTTDRENKRYRFGNQPNIVLWNLFKLANGIYPLIDEVEGLQEILELYKVEFEKSSLNMMRSKLGLFTKLEKDDALVLELEELLLSKEIDMTIFFRLLANFNTYDEDLIFSILQAAVYKSSDLEIEEYVNDFNLWFSKYDYRLQQENSNFQSRKKSMNSVNPKYVLRNYMAHLAIEKAEAKDYSLVNELYTLLLKPYDEQPQFEKWFAKRPEWARHKVGCSMLSCSS